MINQTISHYRVLSLLGRGGMGVVYRAEDTRLGREVALKVLPEGSLADEAARSRFRAEAQSLSRLNHPNIATIYDFDSQDGIDFLVMEYVSGTTLENHVAGQAQAKNEAALSEKEVARLGGQIAEAMEEAHELGIVHRDLKPGNIMVTAKGRVKVLDFGLAKLLRPAGDIGQSNTLSRESREHGVAGTLPYMAPEQLLGEPVDARTDIHAMGAVLYGMATGRPPFSESQSSRLSDAILHQAPVSPRAINARISPELERIILKCMEKEPENRYQSSKELAVDLRRLGTATGVAATTPAATSSARAPSSPAETTSAPTPGVNRGKLRLWVFGKLGLWVFGVVALVAVVALGIILWGGRHAKERWGEKTQTRIDSLAVLPLKNLSADPAQDYFADGMTEELTTELAQISALRVISRTSTMQYKDTHKALPEIAKELNVAAVVEGSVMRSGDRVRITAQLIQAAADKHLWARSYERDLRDVLAMQREVAHDVADQIRITLTPREEKRLAARAPVDPEVHAAYLQGIYHINKGTEAELKTAIHYFENAIEKDQHYAPAFAGLADCYVLLSTYYWAPREAMPKAQAAAMQALQLDESLSEAHASLGSVYLWYGWDWENARKEAQRAIELNPNNALAHDLYAAYLIAVAGKTEEGLKELQRGYEIDPLSGTIMGDTIWLPLMAGKYDLAIENGRKVIATEPNFSPGHVYLAMAYAQTGRFSEAFTEGETARRLDNSPLIWSMAAYAFAASGKPAEARKLLGEIREALKKHYSCSYEVANVYLALGERGRTFEWLQKAYDDRSDCMVFLKVDPRLTSLHSDPRYQDLLRRVGFH